MYGVATDKDRLHSRGGGLRGGVKTTGTIASSVTVPLPAVSAAAIFGVSACRPKR